MSDIKVVVQEEDVIHASTGVYNVPIIPKLEHIGDVDVVTQGKVDGSVLVYNTSTGKWVSTLILEKQLINAGYF